ncbi:MAG: hypothetical protein LJE62_16855, partial [Silicimonas sp.]|nr:hypothetical protein [Silicimonas sp.]
MTPQATSEQGPSAPRKLAAISAAAGVLGAFAVVAIRQLSGGVVHVDLFPSDTLFVIDIIERIAAGQVPHVDFAMHVGSLPYVLAALSGAPTPAEGFLVAQTAFTATCLLIGLWVWHRRLDNLSGPLLLIFILVLGQTLAMPTNSELSLGLFYNRWSWALALLFVCQTLLPAKDKTAPWPDGALAGLIAFMLLTTKITFFVGLLPAALFCTVYRGQWREIGAGLVVFALLALAV